MATFYKAQMQPFDHKSKSNDENKSDKIPMFEIKYNKSKP